MQIHPSALLVVDCFERLNPWVAPIVVNGRQPASHDGLTSRPFSHSDKKRPVDGTIACGSMPGN